MIRIITIIGLLLCSLTSIAEKGKYIAENDIFRNPSLFSVKLSPKEKYYSYVVSEANNYVLKVHHIKAKKYIPLVFEKLEASKISEYTWLDSNTIFVSYKLKGGGELERLISLNFKDNKFNVKVDNINANGFIIDAYPEQNNKVLYALKKRTNTRYILKLYEVTHNDLIAGNIKNLPEFPYQLKDANVIWSSAGTLGALIVDDDEWEYRELNFSSGKWEYVFGDEISDYEFQPIGRLNNGNLAVLSDYESNVKSLYEFDVKTKEFVKILYQHQKYDLVDADLDPKTKRLKVVHYYDHGRYVSNYLSTEDRSVYSAIQSALPDKQFTIESNNSSNYYIVNGFSSTDRGAYYLFDKGNKVLKTIGAIQEELESYQLTPTVVENINIEDGVDIEIYFTKPKRSNGALLVMPHGGPIGVREYANFNYDVQYLASRGFTILQVNFRGSTGFGKSFLEQGVGQFGKLIEKDISSAVDVILKRHKFESVCAIGASYGAYSSLMLAKQKPDLYDCVIARFGIYDLPLLFSSSNLYMLPENRERIERVVGKNSEQLYVDSPLYYLESIKAPILLTAGEKDEVAYFEHSKRLKYRLEQLNSDFEHIFYKNAAHGHSLWSGDQHELAAIYDFLLRKLQLDDNDKTALGSSYAKIADGFDNKYMMKKKPRKVFDYYTKAKNLGHPRSVFNVGSYYHRGEFVNYDIKKAMELYEKASDLDYSIASYRLGNIYYDDVYIDKNYSIALNYYKKAKEQGNRYADLDIGKFYCLGNVVQQNLSECFSAFKVSIDKDETPEQFKKRTEYRNKVIRETLIDINLNKKDRKSLESFISENYDIKEFNPVVDVDDWGLFDGRAHDDTTELVPIIKDQTFGVVLEVESNSENVENGDKSIFLIKWTTPSLKDEKGVPLQTIQTGLRTTKIGDFARIMYSLNRDAELIEGDWKLEVFDIHKNILFEKIFKTFKQ